MPWGSPTRPILRSGSSPKGPTATLCRSWMDPGHERNRGNLVGSESPGKPGRSSQELRSSWRQTQSEMREARRLGYRPALDGVRGIAIAIVVSFHAFGWPAAGTLGVDLFFVLSGFLITTLVLEEQRATGRIALSGFYLRRARRLLPALLVLLLAFLLVALGSGGLRLAIGVGL